MLRLPLHGRYMVWIYCLRDPPLTEYIFPSEANHPPYWSEWLIDDGPLVAQVEGKRKDDPLPCTACRISDMQTSNMYWVASERTAQCSTWEGFPRDHYDYRPLHCSIPRLLPATLPIRTPTKILLVGGATLRSIYCTLYSLSTQSSPAARVPFVNGTEWEGKVCGFGEKPAPKTCNRPPCPPVWHRDHRGFPGAWQGFEASPMLRIEYHPVLGLTDWCSGNLGYVCGVTEALRVLNEKADPSDLVVVGGSQWDWGRDEEAVRQGYASLHQAALRRGRTLLVSPYVPWSDGSYPLPTWMVDYFVQHGAYLRHLALNTRIPVLDLSQVSAARPDRSLEGVHYTAIQLNPSKKPCSPAHQGKTHGCFWAADLFPF
eukprot:Sspe_Gene.74750::Locus_46714_Transcript_2_2_Confidence_0.667_Length_1285::g.74750::m.74750